VVADAPPGSGKGLSDYGLIGFAVLFFAACVLCGFFRTEIVNLVVA